LSLLFLLREEEGEAEKAEEAEEAEEAEAAAHHRRM